MKKNILKRSVCLLITFCIGFACLPSIAGAYGTTSYTFNRAAAKDYVYTWIYGQDPHYGYGQLSTNDSTNFASQVLHAGGVPFYDDGHGMVAWNYSLQVSASWYLPNDFRSYFGDIDGVGEKKAYMMYKVSAYDLATISDAWDWLYNLIGGAGDIVQFCKNDGTTYHTQVVQRRSVNEGYVGEKKVSMAQHAPDSLGGNNWINLKTYIQSSGYVNKNSIPNGGDWVILLKMSPESTTPDGM